MMLLKLVEVEEDRKKLEADKPKPRAKWVVKTTT
jgi:hypothetical protein